MVEDYPCLYNWYSKRYTWRCVCVTLVVSLRGSVVTIRPVCEGALYTSSRFTLQARTSDLFNDYSRKPESSLTGSQWLNLLTFASLGQCSRRWPNMISIGRRPMLSGGPYRDGFHLVRVRKIPAASRILRRWIRTVRSRLSGTHSNNATRRAARATQRASMNLPTWIIWRW